MAEVDRYTIRGTRVHKLTSEEIGQAFTLNVALPLGYSRSEESYPIVYVTDGDLMFANVASWALTMASELPPMIVVGITYDLENLREAMVIRSRDLTPTKVEARTSGGAAAFLRFINEDVKTFMKTHYRVLEDNQTYAGYSLGGLFGLYALLKQPESFQKYIIGSPSIWWDDAVTFSYEAEYAANHSDLDATVFMSSGELEEDSDNPGPSLMVSNMQRMAALLRSRQFPSLKIGSHLFEGETHMSGTATCMNRGLRYVFRGELPSPPDRSDDER
jgi:predicted alpha/beta superfamily hydrolase